MQPHWRAPSRQPGAKGARAKQAAANQRQRDRRAAAVELGADFGVDSCHQLLHAAVLYSRLARVRGKVLVAVDRAVELLHIGADLLGFGHGWKSGRDRMAACSEPPTVWALPVTGRPVDGGGGCPPRGRRASRLTPGARPLLARRSGLHTPPRYAVAAPLPQRGRPWPLCPAVGPWGRGARAPVLLGRRTPTRAAQQESRASTVWKQPARARRDRGSGAGRCAAIPRNCHQPGRHF